MQQLQQHRAQAALPWCGSPVRRAIRWRPGCSARPTPQKKVEQAKGYTAMYGAFREGNETFDEGVALFFRAPHSYTGEDVVELSCHGGNAVARRLVEACLAAGAQPAAPGEYTRRAFLNGKLGLTQAEAVMDLISADGRQGAALANAALGGALAKRSTLKSRSLPPFRHTLPHGWIFPRRMCRSWTMTTCTGY